MMHKQVEINDIVEPGNKTDFHFDQNDRRLYSYEPIIFLSFASQLIQRSILDTVWGQNYLSNNILTV